jgi:hypothetical protein
VDLTVSLYETYFVVKALAVVVVLVVLWLKVKYTEKD